MATEGTMTADDVAQVLQCSRSHGTSEVMSLARMSRSVQVPESSLRKHLLADGYPLVMSQERFRQWIDTKGSRPLDVPDALPEVPVPAAGDCVYFMQAGETGLVKIGWTSSVRRRLQQLRWWSPVPLRLVGATPGDRMLERVFHDAYADLCDHGEWFLPAPSLRNAIVSLRSAP